MDTLEEIFYGIIWKQNILRYLALLEIFFLIWTSYAIYPINKIIQLFCLRAVTIESFSSVYFISKGFAS